MANLKSLVDETTNIKNELINCKNTLKQILTEKKVIVSNTDKLSDLIEKTNNIVCTPTVLTGTIPNISVVEDTGGGISTTIPEINLGSKPSKVLIQYTISSVRFNSGSNSPGGTVTTTNDKNATLLFNHSNGTSSISPTIVLTDTGFTFGVRSITWWVATYTIQNISYEAYFF